MARVELLKLKAIGVSLATEDGEVDVVSRFVGVQLNDERGQLTSS